MKNLFSISFRLASLAVVLLAGTAVMAQAQSAKLQLDQLDALANRASETVDIRLDERLIQTTAKLLGKDPDNVEVRDILKNLKGIYVKVFTFEKESEYAPSEIDFVVAQLRSAGWNKIVTVKSKKATENLEVYLNMTGDLVNGLALISVNPKEFVVVNIVGPVDLDKLSKLEGSFGVPELGIEKDKPKKQ